MTPDEYRDLIKRHPKLAPTAEQALHHISRKAKVLERDVINDSLGSSCLQKRVEGRVLVRVTHVRKRLLDEDNLCSKSVVDLLRYSKIIREDSPGEAKIENCQIKSTKGQEEHVIIEIMANETSSTTIN